LNVKAAIGGHAAAWDRPRSSRSNKETSYELEIPDSAEVGQTIMAVITGDGAESQIERPLRADIREADNEPE
jgi:hypothetical protein